MRYIAQFKDNTSKRLSEKEGKAVIASWAGGAQAILIRGAAFDRSSIFCIKPITNDWFDEDTAKRENPEKMQKLSEILQSHVPKQLQ